MGRLYHIIAFALAVTATVLSIVATATPAWETSSGSTFSSGLFEVCILQHCTRYNSVPKYVNATRAFMIIGSICLLVSAITAFLLLRGKLKKGNIITGGLLSLAFVCLLIGCSVFTAKTRPGLIALNYGYSYGLAWTSFAMSLVATPFAFHAQSGYSVLP